MPACGRQVCNQKDTMLTRRDVLSELRRMGVRKPSLLKNYLRDFERYIGTYYDFQISKTRKGLSEAPPPQGVVFSGKQAKQNPEPVLKLRKRIFSQSWAIVNVSKLPTPLFCTGGKRGLTIIESFSLLERKVIRNIRDWKRMLFPLSGNPISKKEKNISTLRILLTCKNSSNF